MLDVLANAGVCGEMEYDCNVALPDIDAVRPIP